MDTLLIIPILLLSILETRTFGSPSPSQSTTTITANTSQNLSTNNTQPPSTSEGSVKTQNSTLERESEIPNLRCGRKELHSNEIVRIQSLRFGVGNYPEDKSCNWKFIADGDCRLSATCPCFDVPESFDCLGDYLKVVDFPHFIKKYCGTDVPRGIYNATGDVIVMRFRSDRNIETGKGFLCYVQCTPFGKPVQKAPGVKCPAALAYSPVQ